MTRLSAKAARANFSEVVDHVRSQRGRVVVQRNGRDAVAMISLRDLKLLELIEDGMDIRAAKKSLAADKRIPWEQVKSRLGLA